MAWNEPGGGGNRDPWKNRKEGGGIDAWLRRLRDWFGELGNGGGGGGGSPFPANAILLVVVAVLLISTVLTSYTLVDAQHVFVVQRFGKFDRIMHPGFNLKLPVPIERVTQVETTNKQTADDVRMLTKDENIVQIDFTVQYQIVDAQQYLFSATEPEEALKQAAEAAVRQVVGASDMDTILSSHGSDMTAETKTLLQATLDGYAVGLKVNDVNFQNLQPPSEVKAAFDDVNKASNDQKGTINEAQAYSALNVPLARGDAARILAEAAGYKAQRIAAATGEAQRFSLIATQYHSAPEVTRKRLYLETMQAVLGTAQKVVDQTSGKSLLYLPLDKAKADANASNAAIAAQAARNAGVTP